MQEAKIYKKMRVQVIIYKKYFTIKLKYYTICYKTINSKKKGEKICV